MVDVAALVASEVPGVWRAVRVQGGLRRDTVLMAAAKTAAQRKADERQRHKEAGRVAVTVHVRPDYVPEVRALEAKLQRRENRKPRT